MHLDAAGHTDTAYRRGLAVHRRRGARRRRRPRERGAASDHGPLRRERPDDRITRRSSASARTAATRTTNRRRRPTRRSREGDFVLIDLWAKLDQPRAVYSDLTRVGFVGQDVPDEVRGDLPDRRPRPRRRRSPACRRPSPPGGRLQGWQVDDAARDVIEKAGYGAVLRPPHRPQHRPGNARQRRQHGQPGNPRRPPRPAADLLLDRAGHLPARVRRPQRSQRVRRRARARSTSPARPRKTSWP